MSLYHYLPRKYGFFFFSFDINLLLKLPFSALKNNKVRFKYTKSDSLKVAMLNYLVIRVSYFEKIFFKNDFPLVAQK